MGDAGETRLASIAREAAVKSVKDGQPSSELVRYAEGVVRHLAAMYKSAAAVRVLATAVCTEVHPASRDMPCAPEHLQYGESATGGTPMNTRSANVLLAKVLTNDLVEPA